jgi:hypothetical protein
MNRPTTLVLSTTLLCLGVVSPTLAETAKELVGTWTVVSGETVRPDGSRTPTFGDNPKGILVFTSDGRLSTNLHPITAQPGLPMRTRQ